MKIYLKTWFIVLVSVTIIGIPIALVLINLQNKYQRENFIDKNSNEAIKLLESLNANIEKKKVEEEKISANINEIKNKKQKLEVKYKNLHSLDMLDNEINNLKIERENIKSEIIELREEVLIQEYGVYTPVFRYELSNNYKIKLDELIQGQKDLIKNKKAFIIKEPMRLNNSEKKGKAMQERNGKQLVRNYLSETDETLASVSINNYENKKKRIEKSFEQLNKLNRSMNVEISTDLKDIVNEKIDLLIEYKELLAKEKIKASEERHRLKEEQKVQKEIEKLKKELEKEEKRLIKAKKDYEKQLETTTDAKMIDDIKKQLNMIGENIENIKSEDKELDERLKNTRAGYVYIISNIGSFGENIYKIGMTRRQEPLDRVKELGDASVPFKFDVHALIFSDDAYKLENLLHKKFNNKRLNKVNYRKEYFKVSLDEIKNVVQNNFNKPVEFIDQPEAIEFREGLKIKL